MMTPKTQFFMQETIRIVRQMNLPDARRYLGGLLELLGDCDEAHTLRTVLMHLDESDRQLDLIAGPQPRLPLENGH